MNRNVELIFNIHIRLSLKDCLQCGCLRVEMVKALACGIVVCEFELQSHYYVHFWINIFGKGMNPLIVPAMG